MKRWVPILIVLVCVSVRGADTASTPVTYYVQLVRATEGHTPPTFNAKPVGQKLHDRLGNTFAFASYWEVDRQLVTVKTGQPGKYKSNGQELEIELLSPQQKEIRLLKSGRVIQKSRSPVATDSMAIVGGKDDAKTWFLVVRRDKPQVD